jgi:hypothetical protein
LHLPPLLLLHVLSHCPSSLSEVPWHALHHHHHLPLLRLLLLRFPLLLLLLLLWYW